VGEKEQDFGVHKDLICHHSPYFKAAFTSGFEEAKTGIMKLPEAEVGTFQLFYDWLYTQTLWDQKDDKADWPREWQLVRLYIFADMTSIISLMNQCLETMNTISNACGMIQMSCSHYVWENTLIGSPLRGS